MPEEKKIPVKLLDIVWGKCTNGQLCSFWKVDFSSFGNSAGVYIIWTDNEILWTGQGIIFERTLQHRKEAAFEKYKTVATFITWALIDPRYFDRVEKYLFDCLHPLLGQKAPDVKPLPINLPDELNPIPKWTPRGSEWYKPRTP